MPFGRGPPTNQRAISTQSSIQTKSRRWHPSPQSDRSDCGDGCQRRDFVWIEDCVDIALWFVGGPRPNGIYNVGSGQARTFKDLAEAVFVALGKTPQIE